MELDHLLIHTVQQNTQNNKEMIHQRNMRRAMTMTMMMRKVRIVTWTMMMMMMMLMIMMKMTMLLRIVTLSWAEVHEESSSPFEFWVHSEYLRIVIIIIIIITIIIIMMLIADQ